jgi:hypothetical protein
MHGYTITDILGALEAAAIFAAFLLPPGFLLGFASNVLGFRNRSASERFLFSTVLSLSIAPVLAVLLVRFSSLTITVSIFLVAAVVSILLVVRELFGTAGKWRLHRTTWIALSMMAVWVVFALLLLVDWQVGDRLYVSYVAYDHSIRTILVEAAARTGVPPINPLFGLGSAPPLRYYYYWYVLCALPVHLAGISPRASLNGSVIWAGFALAALLPLYLKHYCQEKENLRFKSLVGIGLLLVTGYDLIPFTYLSHRLGALWGDVEWWDTNQVASWIDSLLWVPHHIASLVACLFGYLLLSTIPEDVRLQDRIWIAVLAGAAFSSAAGLSVYVTFVFAIFIVAWTFTILVIRGPQEFFTYVGAGACSVLLALPYLGDLRAPSAAGSRFAFFALRDYPVAQEWLKLQGVTSPRVLQFSQLPSLVIVYLFEFGLYFLVGWYCLRQEIRRGWMISLRERALWVMGGLSLVIVTFVASDSTGVNDLGFRGILIVQFVLLIFAAPLIADLFAGKLQCGLAWKAALWLSLVIGVLGTLVQVGIFRFYAPIVDAGISRRTEPWMGLSPGIGKHTLDMRESLEHLKAITSPTAVLQYNPEGPDLFLFHLYADRQAAAGDESCGAGFGGDPQKCKQFYGYISAVFNKPETTHDWDVDRFCDAVHVNVLVATSSDVVWKDTESWAWTRPPLLANSAMRAIACGTQAATRQRINVP